MAEEEKIEDVVEVEGEVAVKELVSALRKALIWVYALGRSADIDPLETKILIKNLSESTDETSFTKVISLAESMEELNEILNKYDPIQAEITDAVRKETTLEEAVEELKNLKGSLN